MTHQEFVTNFDQIYAKIFVLTCTPDEIEAALQDLADHDPDYDDHMQWCFRTDRKCRKRFEDNRELLRSACRDAYPSISAEDEDAALGRVYARLDEYQGTPRSFKSWAKKQVQSEAAKLEAFHRLQSDYRLFALDGIWSVLSGCGDLDIEERITIPELLAYVGRSIWKNLDSLLAANQPAKVSTRIWWFGHWAARAWKTDELRRRQRPSLAAVEDEPAPEVSEPDFAEQELGPVKTVRDVEPEVSNAPPAGRYRALSCPTCESLETVNAIENDRARLACGHDRSTEWLPAAKDAWSAEQARLRSENKVKRVEKRAA